MKKVYFSPAISVFVDKLIKGAVRKGYLPR